MRGVRTLTVRHGANQGYDDVVADMISRGFTLNESLEELEYLDAIENEGTTNDAERFPNSMSDAICLPGQQFNK